VTPSLSDLHWLPLEQRISSNCVSSPQYLRGLVSLTSDIASLSQLHSATSRRYELPAIRLKFGERCLSFAGPAAWNCLQNIPIHQAFKLNFENGRICYALLVTSGVWGALEKRELELGIVLFAQQD